MSRHMDNARKKIHRERNGHAERNGKAEAPGEMPQPQPQPEPPPWPKHPNDAAYHGLVGDLVRLIEPHSEADPVALLAQALVMAGNAIGRTAHFRVEGAVHYLNEFVTLVGKTAKARKGTSYGHVRGAFESAADGWAEGCIKGGASSGEGIIWHVRDPIVSRQARKEKGRVVGFDEVEADPGVSDKRLLLYEPEFASVLKQTDRQGNTLSTVLRQAWDGGKLQSLTKNSPAVATGAHISIIGHITAEELRRYLTATESANGFGNRFLFVCAKRSKELPLGNPLPEGALAPLQSRLMDALKFAKETQGMELDGQSRHAWCAVYRDLSEGRPGLAGALLSRSEAHVMRLACLYAILDKSSLIREEHLAAALALWDYVEASVRHIFGDTTGDGTADEILQALRARAEGMSRTDLMTYFGRNQSSDRIGRALSLLAGHRLAHEVKQNTGGRPAERWLAGPPPRQ